MAPPTKPPADRVTSWPAILLHLPPPLLERLRRASRLTRRSQRELLTMGLRATLGLMAELEDADELESVVVRCGENRARSSRGVHRLPANRNGELSGD